MGTAPAADNQLMHPSRTRGGPIEAAASALPHCRPAAHPSRTRGGPIEADRATKPSLPMPGIRRELAAAPLKRGSPGYEADDVIWHPSRTRGGPIEATVRASRYSG